MLLEVEPISIGRLSAIAVGLSILEFPLLALLSAVRVLPLEPPGLVDLGVVRLVPDSRQRRWHFRSLFCLPL